jgi:hypothetical protein
VGERMTQSHESRDEDEDEEIGDTGVMKKR